LTDFFIFFSLSRENSFSANFAETSLRKHENPFFTLRQKHKNGSGAKPKPIMKTGFQTPAEHVSGDLPCPLPFPFLQERRLKTAFKTV